MGYGSAVAFSTLVALAGCTLVYAGDLDDAREPSLVVVDASDAKPTVSDATSDAFEASPDAPIESAYAALVRADAPVAHWRLEDPAGSTTLHDEIGSHDLVITNPGALAFGAKGVGGSRGITTTGATELQVTGLPTIGNGAKFTMEAWVRATFTDAHYAVVFEKNTLENEVRKGIFLWVNPGRDQGTAVEAWDGKTIITAASGPGVLTRERFTHLVVVCDGSLTVYVDGAATDPSGTFNFPDPSPILSWGDAFIGDLDELAVYDHALTSEQIIAHTNAGR